MLVQYQIELQYSYEYEYRYNRIRSRTLLNRTISLHFSFDTRTEYYVAYQIIPSHESLANFLIDTCTKYVN